MPCNVSNRKIDLIVERARQFDQLRAAQAPDCEITAMLLEYQAKGLTYAPSEMRKYLPKQVDPKASLETRVLDCIREYRYIHFKSIMEICQLDQKHAHAILLALWKRGKVFRFTNSHQSWFYVDQAYKPGKDGE